jgi:hypothetical protein
MRRGGKKVRFLAGIGAYGRSLAVYCWQCHHETMINADQRPLKLRCRHARQVGHRETTMILVAFRHGLRAAAADCSIRDVVANVQSAVESLAKEKEIGLTVDLAPDLPSAVQNP